jgi:hypothetical protein
LSPSGGSLDSFLITPYVLKGNAMEKTKEAAKIKRQCSEIAARIHDVVEENLWTDYNLLPELSQELIEKIHVYESMKKDQ